MSRVRAVPRYEVLADGRVLSHWRRSGPIEMRPRLNSHGYLYLRIIENGRRRELPVHVLVARHHLPPRPSPAHEVRHLDGDRLNNMARNLAWGTRAENAADRERHGRTSRGEDRWSAKLSAVDVITIRRRATAGETQAAIAGSYGVTRQQVGNIVKGRSWTHVD